MSVSSRFLGVLAVLLLSILLPAAATARPGDPVPGFGADGLAVTTPDPAGREAPADMARLADGSLLVAGSAASGAGSLLVKYGPGGSIDTDFGDQGKLRGSGPGWQQVDLLPDGRIMLGGGKGTQLVFQRLNPDGSPDPAFGDGGRVSLDTSGISPSSAALPVDSGLASLRVLAGGEIRAFGGFAGCDHYPGFCGSALAAGLEENGDPSPGFGTAGVKDLKVHGDSIVATTFADGRSLVVRSENYGADGGQTFAVPVSLSGQPGQEVTVSGGYSYHPALEEHPGNAGTAPTDRVLLTSGDAVWRLFADGRIDHGFGTDGMADIRGLTRFIPGEARFSPTDIVTDDKHRILISGGLVGGRDRSGRADASASSGAVARLRADGRIDSSFGGGGLSLVWSGQRIGERLEGRTAITVSGGSAILAGMGPVDGSYGFTLARIRNNAMMMPRCHGERVDYVGTAGTDRVEPHMSVVLTGGGDDVVTGSGYRATICTGSGNDSVSLIQGPAKVFTGHGGDRISLGSRSMDPLRPYEAHSGPGNDRVIGSPRSDRLYGGSGNDLIRGGGRDDRLFGGRGKDRLYGQSGRDQLFGGPGVDSLKVGGIGPDPTDYVLQRRSGLIRITIEGRKGSAVLRLPYVCTLNTTSRGDLGLGEIPFDPRTGRLGRAGGRPGDPTEVRAQVSGPRITGRLRVIDDFEYAENTPCRTGKPPFRRKTMLRDAWVRFSIKARPKPRQFIRQ